MVRKVLIPALLLSLAGAYAQTSAPAPSPAPSPAAAQSAATPAPAASSGTSAKLVSSGGIAPRVTFSRVNVDGPYIAMTFDDGPSGAEYAPPPRSRRQEAHQAHLLPHRRKRRALPATRAARAGRGPPGRQSLLHPSRSRQDERRRRPRGNPKNPGRHHRRLAATSRSSSARPTARSPRGSALGRPRFRRQDHPLGCRSARLETPRPRVVASRIIAGDAPRDRSSSRTISIPRPSMPCRRSSIPSSPKATNSSPSRSCSPWTRARPRSPRPNPPAAPADAAPATVAAIPASTP